MITPVALTKNPKFKRHLENVAENAIFATKHIPFCNSHMKSKTN
jgi:hypothetical protein